ncbi:guanylate kinase [bacterium]|nr:guanylate kinase [bacterium]
MPKRGLLIVISSPSGGGKTTICERLLRHDRLLSQSISMTTRSPRGRERYGREYYFIDKAGFQKSIRAQQFLEWAQVHGHYYGTLKAEVEKQQRAGRDIVLVIDVQGGLAVKRFNPEAILIFIKPPSFKALEARLRGRGTDERPTISGRLRHARLEMAQALNYDYVVINRQLPEAVRQIEAVLTAERLKVRKR